MDDITKPVADYQDGPWFVPFVLHGSLTLGPKLSVLPIKGILKLGVNLN